jgi:hypothetical protein
MNVQPRYAASSLALAAGAYLDLGNPAVLSGLQSFTLEAWVNPSSTDGQQSVIGQRDVGVAGGAGYQLYLDNGCPAVYYPTSPDPLASPTPLTTGDWHFLACSFDAAAGQLDLYVDFDQQPSLAATPSTAPISVDALLGATLNGGSPDWFLQGMLGEVLVWSSVRTLEQILADAVQMNVLAATAEPTLELYLDFSIMPAIDMSGNDLTVTFAGGAQYSVSTPGLVLAGTGYADCGSPAILDRPGNAPYTLEGWFSPSAPGVIVSKFQGQANSQYQVSYNASNQLVAYRNSDGQQIVSSAALPPGAFYHFAMTYDDVNQLLSLYVDGNLQAVALFPSAVPAAADVNLLIGANQNADGAVANFFQGQIQNLRIWNVCLDQEDVQQWIYNDPIDDEALIADFNFSANPPLDSTQQVFIQLAGDAAIATAASAVDPTSPEGSLGILLPVNAEYYDPTPDPAVAPPPAVLAVAGQPAPFSDAHREACWELLIASSRAASDPARRGELRRRFEAGYREAQARVAANPRLLEVFSHVEEDGVLKVFYHGPRGDLLVLTVPVGSVSDCELWWIELVFALTVGFLQALGFVVTAGDIAKRIYNLLVQNPAVVEALMSLLGATISVGAAFAVLNVVYAQNLFWSIVELVAPSAGWFVLGWLAKKVIGLLLGLEAAELLAGFIVWAAQLATLATQHKTACPTKLAGVPAPEAVAA